MNAHHQMLSHPPPSSTTVHHPTQVIAPSCCMYLANKMASSSAASSPQRSFNGHSSSPMKQCTRIIEVQQFTTTSRSSSPGSNKKLPSYSSSSSYSEKQQQQQTGNVEEEGSEKSFIQQRIERLYGPAALGMAFRARRALMERNKDPQDDDAIQNFNCVESPPPPSQSLPSVFRHLRPEFRHQLPVKASRKGFGGWDLQQLQQYDSNDVIKNSCDTSNLRNGSTTTTTKGVNGTTISNGMNGHHTVRHIPIVLEDTKDEPKISSKNIISNDVKRVNGEPLPNKPVVNKEESRGVLLVKPVEKDVNKVVEDKENSDSKRANFMSRLIEETPQPSLLQEEVKDGKYFLQVVAKEVSNLEPVIQRVEEDLKTSGEVMTEEVRGKLLAASGKAKLLINQKIEQFKGLCHKNLTKSKKEEFPTTNEDLAGFWDMVSIQVVNVKELLEEVDALRNNQWIELPSELISNEHKIKISSNARKLKCGPSSTISGGGRGGQKRTDNKEVTLTNAANEERRKAMREAIAAKRKAALKNKVQSDEGVEIFVSNT